MRYYLIAGEASGDIHGSALMRSIKSSDPNAEFRFWGGDEMESVSEGLVKHYRDTSFMGFIEVIKNLFVIMKLFSFCKKDITAFSPDKIIFIDYPGFNLRMASWAKKNGYETIYYIAPQVWAWKESRVKKIKKSIDHLFVILPFEKAFFEKHSIDAKYFGHPLTTRIERFLDSHKINENIPKDCIACFPGSRSQEIRAHMDVIIQAAKKLPNEKFVIAGVQSVETNVYKQAYNQNIDIIFNKNYQLLSKAKLAIVTSGTATLETALFNVPQVVIYKGNELSYQIAKRIIKLEYISLVNLLSNKEVVKELIQNQLTTDNLTKEIRSLMDKAVIESQRHAYGQIRQMLGTEDPSIEIAKIITQN